jgi:aryl-alcohol dehydrogenase-like predicted oxidoreductase
MSSTARQLSLPAQRTISARPSELASNGYQRDEIVVATKGGFLPYDSVPPKDARVYFEEAFIKPGIVNPSAIVANCHCMTPQYLLNQLDCSLRNLDVETIDIYYVHNPETQLGKISRDEFNQRLLQAFETLEGAVAAGKIRRRRAATEQL